MRWLKGIWQCLVGAPEDCSIEDPATLLQVKALVKRAFVLGFIAGFLACTLLYKGFLAE